MASVDIAEDSNNLADLSPSDLTLIHVQSGKELRGLPQCLISAHLERSLVGATTLTLELTDNDEEILSFLDRNESGRLHALDVNLDKMWFRLQQMSYSYGPDGFSLTLICEDRDVAFLRQHTKFKKVVRGKWTRAEFIQSLVKEVKAGGGIQFVCPSLESKQDEAKSDADKYASRRKERNQSKKTKNAKRQPGLTEGARVTVKGAPATKAQKANMEKLLDIARDNNAGPKATKALIAAAIVESEMLNKAGGDADSSGILQVRKGTAASLRINPRSIEDVAEVFLKKGFTGAGGAIALSRDASRSAGDVAAMVQGPRKDLRGEYDKRSAEADRIVNAYGGPKATKRDDDEGVREKAYEFTRGKKESNEEEDSWTAIQRLAEEVRWNAWLVNGVMYFMHDEEISKSRARAIISRENEAVVDFDFEIDNRKPVQELNLTIFADRWTFPPGSVIEIQDKIKACDGRWIISTIAKDLSSPLAQITLRRPVPKRKEPAPESETREGYGGAGEGGARAGGSGPAASSTATGKARSAARAISKRNLPYVWGGGHERAGVPSNGTGRDKGTGFDCSGYVAAVLKGGGMLPSGWANGVPASGTFASSYGEPGQGKRQTVWANGGHVYIEYNLGNGRWAYADTSRRSGVGGPGPHLRYPKERMSNAGFTPRHWPGT